MVYEIMKKILFIILEIDSASGICVTNIAERMVQKGWEVHILSYPTERKLNNKIDKIDIRPEFFRYMKQRCYDKTHLNKVFSRCYKLKVAITTFMWPWNSPIFTLRLLKKAYHLYRKNKYDCIVPVYTQLDPVIVGHILKNKYKEAKIVPYFLDSLSAGPVPKLLSENKKIKKGLRWEKCLLRNADRVIFMKSSECHHRTYSVNSDYYKNVVFLDIPMLCIDFGNELMKKKDECGKDFSDRNSVTITYVGSLPKGIRNPEPAFKILSLVKNIKFHVFVVGVSEDEARKFNTFDLDISWLGKLSHEEAVRYAIKSDILLNIGNNVEGMVPSKIFEYMSYGKPILSFASIEKEPSLPYLKKYPKACIIMENEKIESSINNIEAFARNTSEITISKEILLSKFYENTPDCFLDTISSIVNK